MDEEAAGREIDRVATDIALASILRALIGEVFATDDRFRVSSQASGV
jgi:hypothetical protein